MYATCTICNSAPTFLEWNGLPIAQCTQCGLAWRRSFALPEGHYEEKDIDTGSEKVSARRRNNDSRRSLLARYTALSGVCDIGCGEGLFVEGVLAVGGHCIGIDPGAEPVAFGIERGLPIRLGRIEDLPQIALEYPLRVSTMFELIEHLSDPLSALQTVYSALPVGGVLMIETPNFAAPSITKRQYRHSLVYPEHLFYFTEATLAAIVAKAGFHVRAHGRRHFDEDHLALSQSLELLGVRMRSDAAAADYQFRMEPGQSEASPTSSNNSPFRSIARTALARIVRLLGRGEYQWLIAVKQ